MKKNTGLTPTSKYQLQAWNRHDEHTIPNTMSKSSRSIGKKMCHFKTLGRSTYIPQRGSCLRANEQGNAVVASAHREQRRTTLLYCSTYSVTVVRDELEKIEGLIRCVHLQVQVPRAAGVTIHDITPARFVHPIVCFHTMKITRRR